MRGGGCCRPLVVPRIGDLPVLAQRELLGAKVCPLDDCVLEKWGWNSVAHGKMHVCAALQSGVDGFSDAGILVRSNLVVKRAFVDG